MHPHQAEYDLIHFTPAPEHYTGNLDQVLPQITETLEHYTTQADRILTTPNTEEALSLITTMMTGSTYHLCREAQHYHRKQVEKIEREVSALGRSIDRSVAHPNPHDVSRIYPLSQEAIQHWENHILMKQNADRILNLAATLAHHAETQGAFCSTITEWNGDTLGTTGITRGASYSVGTREWLEYRQGGLGASDVAGLNEQGNWRYKNVRRIWESKTTPIPEEQVQEQTLAQEVFNDAMSRGNAFEEYIGHLYAIRNPGTTILHNKDTWISAHNNIRVNYDLLTSSDGATPDGVLEIKTASTSKEWGADNTGLEGIPEGYGIQLLVQMYHAGFTHGALAVLIDGHDHRCYHVTMTAELRERVQHYIQKAEEVFAQARLACQGMPHTAPAEVDYVPSRDFKKAETRTHELNDAKIPYLKEIAALQDEPVELVMERYQLKISYTDGSPESVNAVLRGMYENLQPRNLDRFSGIDLETTGERGTRGRIIEVGITGKRSINQLYNVDDKHLSIFGTGAEDVHHISADIIAGKDLLDEENQAAILAACMEAKYLLAHNAAFEKGFLRSQIRGFAEAEARGKIVFADTMNIAKYGIPSLERYNMESFVAKYGVEYRNAHRAYDDADMMMQAFGEWAAS